MQGEHHHRDRMGAGSAHRASFRGSSTCWNNIKHDRSRGQRHPQTGRHRGCSPACLRGGAWRLQPLPPPSGKRFFLYGSGAVAYSAQARRQQDVDQASLDISWKAQVRLCNRYQRLLHGGKPKNKVIACIARELTGFIWAVGQLPMMGREKAISQ